MPGWAQNVAGWYLAKTAKAALEFRILSLKGSSAEHQNFKALAKMSPRSHNNETFSLRH